MVEAEVVVAEVVVYVAAVDSFAELVEVEVAGVAAVVDNKPVAALVLLLNY